MRSMLGLMTKSVRFSEWTHKMPFPPKYSAPVRLALTLVWGIGMRSRVAFDFLEAWLWSINEI